MVPSEVTLTEYAPGPISATTNVPLNDVPGPEELEPVPMIVHEYVLTDIPLPVPPPIVHCVAPYVGITPLTATSVPGGPCVGLIVMSWFEVLMVKVAGAVSPAMLPVAVIV